MAFLGWIDELQSLAFPFLGMAIFGLVLIIASGYEGRLAVGILCLIGDLILVGRGFSSEIIALATYATVAVIGIALVYSTVRELLESIRSFAFRRGGGYTGTVRNLLKEGDLMTFWLDGAGKDGRPFRVEGMISEGVIKEGDLAWVRGSLNERGVILTNRIQELSKIGAGQTLAQKGKEEFSGVVLGEIYDLPRPTLFGLIPLLPFLIFFRSKKGLRIQRVTADGSPLNLIEAEIFALDLKGVVLDRDLVKVKGEWQKSGRFRISEIENMTSKTRAR